MTHRTYHRVESTTLSSSVVCSIIDKSRTKFKKSVRQRLIVSSPKFCEFIASCVAPKSLYLRRMQLLDNPRIYHKSLNSCRLGQTNRIQTTLQKGVCVIFVSLCLLNERRSDKCEYFVEETLGPNGIDTGLRSRAPIGWSVSLGLFPLQLSRMPSSDCPFKCQAKGSNCLIKGIV